MRRSALPHILRVSAFEVDDGRKGWRESGQGPELYGLRQVIEPLSLRMLVYKMGTEIRHCDED